MREGNPANPPALSVLVLVLVVDLCATGPTEDDDEHDDDRDDQTSPDAIQASVANCTRMLKMTHQVVLRA